MDIWAMPTMDTRGLFAEERDDLLVLLGELAPHEWAVPTPAEGWTVKDVALHLLDGDLGRLSRDRDGDTTGLLAVDANAEGFAVALAAKNQRWADAARQLSPRLIRDLLGYSTGQLNEWTAEAHLQAPARVSWASDKPVPAWLDLARELTETWVHHQQIRAATGRDTDTRRLPTVLRTFVWALPHQYRVAADPGTTVAIDLDIGGRWHLVAAAAGQWVLNEGPGANPTASLTFTADAAWRSFTGAALPSDGIRQTGSSKLTDPMLDIRGIIA